MEKSPQEQLAEDIAEHKIEQKCAEQLAQLDERVNVWSQLPGYGEGLTKMPKANARRIVYMLDLTTKAFCDLPANTLNMIFEDVKPEDILAAVNKAMREIKSVA